MFIYGQHGDVDHELSDMNYSLKRSCRVEKTARLNPMLQIERIQKTLWCLQSVKKSPNRSHFAMLQSVGFCIYNFSNFCFQLNNQFKSIHCPQRRLLLPCQINHLQFRRQIWIDAVNLHKPRFIC